MNETIQVRKRGVVTLPADLRQKYGIEEGDIFRVLDLDGLLVLTPMVPMIPELARHIERIFLETGVTMEDMFAALEEERERYYQEHYADGSEA